MPNKVKKCNNCGSENEINFVNCSSCGNILTDKDLTDVYVDESINNLDFQNIAEKNVNKKKQIKALSSTKFAYLVFVLLVIGSFILIISGTFNSPESMSVVNNQVPDDHNHSNINRSNINKINELESFVTANPENYDKLLELAHLLNDSELNDKAIFYYKKYLDKFPKSANVIIDMGVCYYEKGQTNKAIEIMESALEIEPKHHIAHLNLGIVNMAAGNIDVAKVWWQKAVEIDPNSQVGLRAKELLNQH